jgi:RNA polymerase sigma-70 factor (ECF subfamily)
MENWMDELASRDSNESLGAKPISGGGELLAMPSATRAPRERFDAEAMPHMNDLFRTACRLTGERGHAEDAVQEAFLQAWKSFDRFEPGTNCRAWLFKILFHCVNHQRRRIFRFPLLKQTEDFIEANLTAKTPLPDKLTDGEILAALDKIAEDFRAVILLVDVEEFAYKEVAEILNIPIGTVMSRLSRGRKALREQLSAVAESYGIVRPKRKEQSA